MTLRGHLDECGRRNDMEPVVCSALDMLEQVDDEETLSSVARELTAGTSHSRRLCKAKLALERALQMPQTNPLELALPGEEAYKANPSLHLKDDIAGKVLILSAKSGRLHAERNFTSQMIELLMRVDNQEVLREVAEGLDSWPYHGSKEFCRLARAKQVLETFTREHADTGGRTAPCDHSVMKRGIETWLHENVGDGRAESQKKEACITMLKCRTYDGQVLANVQWGLAHWQQEEHSLAWTRLVKAEQFLRQH